MGRKVSGKDKKTFNLQRKLVENPNRYWPEGPNSGLPMKKYDECPNYNQPEGLDLGI